MKRSSVAARSRAAFTLIELLTVIAIISILMAMLFPMVTSVQQNAKKQKARQDCLSIVHAVEGYYTEYGQYPKMDPTASSTVASDESAGDTVSGAQNRNSALFNTLRDIDKTPNANHVQNPKRQVLFAANAVSNPQKPKEGFLDTAGGAGGTLGSFYDPWGSEYGIVLDSNSDNLLDVKSFYGDYADADAPRVSVGAFSMGKDKTLGKAGNAHYRDGTDKSDDVISWAN